jgi:uncharacterized protein VirK/YbjX
LKGEQQIKSSPGSFLSVGSSLISALRYPHATQDWLSFLRVFELQHALPPALPEIVMKPLANYAIYRLTLKERIALLRSHYSIVANTLPANVLSALWTGSSVNLGKLKGKRGKNYYLTLDPARHCGKEGEYTFTFTDESGSQPSTARTWRPGY